MDEIGESSINEIRLLSIFYGGSTVFIRCLNMKVSLSVSVPEE